MSGLALAANGEPKATIYLMPEADATEQHAARELAQHLAAISGARLPIATTADAAAPGIHLGRRALLPDLDWAALGEDGVVVETVGERLLLAGNNPRGTLYAVYELLDRVLGCRWLAPGVSHLPAQPTLAVRDLSIRHRPTFRYREPYFSCVHDADWAARNRANGNFFPLTAVHGGKYEYAGFVHTFYALLPPAEFFAAHPEYYSEIDGQRLSQHGQLCLTHPAVADLVTERVRALLKQQPGARIVSISQNDWGNQCRCATCRAVDEAEGSSAGTMVRFLNTIAARLEAEFPQVLFDTLAYTYTVEPPKTVRPRRNVIMRLCQIMSCDAHALGGCPRNVPFQHYLDVWPKISPEVFVWDYFNNFSHYFMPYPNLDGIIADLPKYARGGVTGVFCQGDATPAKGPGDMAELRAWLCARLMWRPELDGWGLVREFCTLYYGAAAPEILTYLELLHAPQRDGSMHFHLYEQMPHPLFTPERLARARALFDAAAAAVKGDTALAERVATARLPLDYLDWREQTRFRLTARRYQPEKNEKLALAQAFLARAKAHGAAGLREGGVSIDEVITALKGFPATTLRHGGLRLAAVPALGGRLLGFSDDVSGLEWLAVGQPHEPDYPVTGGYEEYTSAQWHSPGWRGPFESRRTGAGLALRARLENGFDLERTFAIESGETRGVCAVTAIRNASDAARALQLRCHPELAVTDWTTARLLAAQPGGGWRDVSPWREGKPAGDVWLTDAAVPAGEWVLVRGAYCLRMSFTPGTVQKCLLGWNRAAGVVRAELYGQELVLPPGETYTFTQHWRLASAPIV